MNIVELAKQLNLGVATVSRSLNDRPGVSSKTRQIVLAKAKELGFIPNANARRLVTGRNFIIRLECPYNTHILSDSYLLGLARALEAAAGPHGYNLIMRLGPQQTTDYQPADGIVIVDYHEMTPSHFEQLTGFGQIPSVLVGETDLPAGPKSSLIYIDPLPGVREAIQRLAQLGHRRIAYIGTGLSTNKVRAAFPSMLAEAGLIWDPKLAIEAGESQRDGFRVAKELLSLPSPPTAIFARTDMLAVGAIHAVHYLGLTVPADISIVGHDDTDIATLVDPPLTSVAIDMLQIAVAAVDALLGIIKGDKPSNIQTLSAHLVTRDSWGPVSTLKRASSSRSDRAESLVLR